MSKKKHSKKEKQNKSNMNDFSGPNDNTLVGVDPDADLCQQSDLDCCNAPAAQNCSMNEVVLPPHIFSRVETSPTKKPRLSFYTNREFNGEPIVSIKIKRRQAKLLNTILS